MKDVNYDLLRTTAPSPGSKVILGEVVYDVVASDLSCDGCAFAVSKGGPLGIYDCTKPKSAFLLHCIPNGSNSLYIHYKESDGA